MNFLLAALPLAPVLAAQGLRVRRTAPRLPEAGGPRQGLTGTGTAQPYRLAVVGESTAAGVGAGSHDNALAGHLASALAASLGRPVRWQVAARTGATTRVTIKELLGELEPADLAVVALGVNDLLELTRLSAFERDLTELLGLIPAGRVLVAGMAPVGSFPALPQPLRAVMGLRAGQLDRVIARVAGDRHVPMDLPVDGAGFFAEDGFHPSGQGYELWAEGLAARVRVT